MSSKHLEPATIVASVFAEVIVDRHFQGNRLTVQVQDDGSVQFHDKGAKDALALDIGRAIIRHGKLEIVVADHGDKSLYVTTWIAVAQYSPHAQFAPDEPAPAPAPSLPSASPPTREPNRARIVEITRSLEDIQGLAGQHADYEDWATAYVLSQAAVDLLRRTIEELDV